MYSHAEFGQAPLLDAGLTDFFNQHFVDIDDIIENVEKRFQERKIQKEPSLSEYMAHLTPLTHSYKIQDPPARENYNPPYFLYDEFGITRVARINGVDALRTTPPFGELTHNHGYESESEDETPEPQTPPSVVASDLPRHFQAFEASSSGSQSWDWEVESNRSSNRSSRSISPSFSTRGSSASSYESSERGSDSDTAHTSSRGPSPGADVSGKWFESASNLATLDPTFSRATLPIQWPHGDQLATDVVYDLQGYWPVMPMEGPLLQARSPSPLPFLTPSPSPSALGKRVSPEVEEITYKRSRRSLTPDEYYPQAGPSTLPYRTPSPSYNGDSDYASPPPVSRRKATKPRKKTRAPRAHKDPKATVCGKRFKCIVKSCTQHAFAAPKDRNRHMDIHFPARFRCAGCQKMFPRDDALKRHAQNAKPSAKKCHSCYKVGGDYAVCEPYWKTCDMTLLVCPPRWDPLFPDFVQRTRNEVSEEAAEALFASNDQDSD